VFVYQLELHAVVQRIDCHDDPVSSVAMGDSNHVLVTGGWDGLFKVPLLRSRLPPPPFLSLLTSSRCVSMRCAALSTQVWTISEDGHVDDAPIQSFSNHECQITAVGINPNDQSAVSASADAVLCFYDLVSGVTMSVVVRRAVSSGCRLSLSLSYATRVMTVVACLHEHQNVLVSEAVVGDVGGGGVSGVSSIAWVRTGVCGRASAAVVVGCVDGRIACFSWEGVCLGYVTTGEVVRFAVDSLLSCLALFPLRWCRCAASSRPRLAL
jgi:WD40 repeat protein